MPDKAGYNKFENLIPWDILEEHLKSEKEKWTIQAVSGSGEDREKACGRVLQLMDMLNLPNTLDMLYNKEDEKDADR